MYNPFSTKKELKQIAELQQAEGPLDLEKAYSINQKLFIKNLIQMGLTLVTALVVVSLVAKELKK